MFAINLSWWFCQSKQFPMICDPCKCICDEFLSCFRGRITLSDNCLLCYSFSQNSIRIHCPLEFCEIPKFSRQAEHAGKLTYINDIVFSHKITAICVFDIVLKCNYFFFYIFLWKFTVYLLFESPACYASVLNFGISPDSSGKLLDMFCWAQFLTPFTLNGQFAGVLIWHAGDRGAIPVWGDILIF